MILLLLLLLQNPPMPMEGACSVEPGRVCIQFKMIVDGGTRAFTAADFGKPLNMIDENPSCEGFWIRGSVRYFSNGTAPTSLVGTLYPNMPANAPPNFEKPTIHLHSKEYVLGFKVTQANSGGAELRWECDV